MIMGNFKEFKFVIVQLVLFCPFIGVFQPVHARSDCALNNRWRTPGECVHFRECDYQKGRFRVGSEVTTCPGSRGVVCCPTQESLSQKYCAKWLEILHAPISFDQPRLSMPLCAQEHRGFITGGREAELYEYPHSVALGFGNNKDKLNFLCGATLINSEYMLSAAHCVTNRNAGKPTYALIGDTKLKPEDGKQLPYRKLIPIAEHILHPNYKPPLIYHDIALLRLSKPLDLDRFILPACIGTPITAAKRKQEVEASGWGITDITSSSTSNVLRSINITAIELNACNQVFDLEPDKPYRYPEGILKSQICASGDEKDTCRGDSGGGLVTREHSCLFHVVGVTSIGSKFCGLGNPSVYTNVASYQDWIEGIVWPNEGP